MNEAMRREILAGLSTFFTIAYYFLLYPKVLSEGGFDFGASLTATIATLVLSTLFLAIYGRFPAVLAPGLAIAVYLVYSVILPHRATWQIALGIVFWSGLIIFLLSIFKIRQKILLHIPQTLLAAAIAGIGLFLIFVGLRDLSILIPDPHTFFRLGEIATLPHAIVLFGLVLFFVLHFYRITGAFLLSILACWILSIFFGFSSFKGVVALPPPILPSFLHLDLINALNPSMWGILISVILISLFDSTASLTALARLAHTMDDRGHIKNIDKIIISDGLGSMASALFGATTLSFFLESSSGIKVGGRTGMTAFVTALCSLICLFFYPLISSIPLFASTPALIAIGCFMTLEIKRISWRYWTDLVPSLLTLLIIPLTFSIYKGFAIGFISYALFKAVTGQWRRVSFICWILALIFILHLSWAIATNNL